MYYLNFPFSKACNMKILTWNILGALTRDANAEERVAEKIPAEINGANPDTILITLKSDNGKISLTNSSSTYTSLLFQWRWLISGKILW